MSEVRAPTLLESIALGGASCIFTVNFTHPIETVGRKRHLPSFKALHQTSSHQLSSLNDQVKTRMQVTGDGLGVVIRNTLKNEGVGSFWKGIVWAWGREGSYASIKLGGYAPVRDALGASGKDGT
jgi:hypothetical protein